MEKYKANITVSENPIQLTARVLDLSDTGNLTIVFNKPYILPPLKVFEVDRTEANS